SLREEVHTTTSKSQSKSVSAAKNISNQHPKLKPILHKKVLEMCGVDMLGQADRLKTLAQYQHGLPDQRPSEEVDGRIVWRPAWSEHVDHTVNIRFLHSIVDGIMEDEKTKHSQAKGELDDNDYVSTTIMTMAKSYWRMLASDIRAMADPQGQAKRKDRISDKRHCSRRGQIAHRRRGAMEEFEKKFGVQGAAAMIDSDFGSDNQTIDEESLSEDTNMRRKEQDVPTNGWKRVGLTWRSLDYVAFLRILDAIHKQQRVVDPQVSSSGPAQPDSTAGTSGPAPKRRKMTKKKDNFMKSFDVHPSQMEDRPPHSAKAKPTIPFKTMIHETWLLAHPGQQVVDGMEWLEGFYLRAREGELSRNDWAYLDELAEFLASDLDN
ncbi:hypothetical protein EDC04DRAFT_2535924, partial [Pisolithus marmoratus]